MDATTPAPLSHAQARLIVIGMMLPVFMGSVDQSILSSALPPSAASSKTSTTCRG